MKRLVLIAFGILFLLVPATSFAELPCTINASQLCTMYNDFGADNHGDCVSYFVSEYNEICGGDFVAKACNFYVNCDPFEGLACFAAYLVNGFYVYKNQGECVSEHKAADAADK